MEAWARLHQAGGWFVQSSPEWCRLWWKHFGGRGRRLFVLAEEDGGDIQAVAPFMIESGRFLRQLKFIGSGLTDYHDVIFDPERGSGAAERFLETVHQERRIDLVNLEQISQNSPLCALLREKRSYRSRAMSDCLSLLLDFPDWEAYEGRLSKKFRKYCRYSLRRLEREGRVEFRRFGSGEISSDQTRAVFEMVGENYRGTGRFDKLNLKPMRSFISGMIKNIPQTTLFTLRLDDTLLAYSLGFFQNGIYYHWNSAFDHRYSQNSPGVLLLYGLIRQLIREERAREVDFMRGDYGYKHRYLVDERRFVNYQFFHHTGSIRGSFGLQYYSKWKWTGKKALGKVLNHPGVYRWLVGKKHASRSVPD